MFAARRAMFGGSVPPPTYVSVSPASGKSGNTVTITGTNFITGNTTVHFNNVLATSVNVTSSTSLTCVVPAATTSNNTAIPIKITTPSGSVTTGNVYTFFLAPTITSFNPGNRNANQSGNVTIAGTNFVSGGTTVTVNGTAYAVTFNSATSLTVGFPALGRGTYAVVVATTGGSASANYAYIITPSISSISPNSVFVNNNTTYTLSGSGFTTGSVPSIYVSPDNVYVTVNGGATNTSCSFTRNFTTTGNRTVSIAGYDAWSNGVTIAVNAIPAPSISSVTTSRGANGALTGSTVTLGGSNLTGASVSIGGTAVSATVSATSISFSCPNLSTDGSKTISVSTTGGSASSSVQFWAARAGSLVVNATSGSGSYTPPQWANFLDVVVRGGGGGGGAASSLNWGGGGSAGAGNSTTVNLVSSGFGARSWAVGGGGANGGSKGANLPGNAGGTSSGAGISAGGGAGGCGNCRGGAGAAGSAVTLGLCSSAAPTGGGGGNSSAAGANPGSGGGGGNSGFGPFLGVAGRAGAVRMAIRQ